MCSEWVLCLCLQDVNDDAPLFVSSSSEVVEAEPEYVPVTEEQASDSEGETVGYLEAREEGITLPGLPGKGDDAETVVFDVETLIFSDPGDPQPSTSTSGITHPLPLYTIYHCILCFICGISTVYYVWCVSCYAAPLTLVVLGVMGVWTTNVYYVLCLLYAALPLYTIYHCILCFICGIVTVYYVWCLLYAALPLYTIYHCILCFICDITTVYYVWCF